MDSLNYPRSKRNEQAIKARRMVGLAIASSAVLSFPLISMADDLYTGATGSVTDTPYIDGGDWFNPQNWNNGNTNPATNTLPSVTITPANINADTGFTPTADPNLVIDSQSVLDNLGSDLGAVFDPVGSSFQSNVPAGDSLTLNQLYISSASSKPVTIIQPNLLTMKSGTLEMTKASSPVIIGRDGLGILNQDGGTFVSDITIQVGITNATAGLGVIDYTGGVLQAGITSGGVATTTSSPGIRLGNSTGTLGIIHVHNDGNASSKILLDGLFVSDVSGSLGVLDYAYENGNVKTINVTGGGLATEGELAIRNYAATPTFGTGVDGTGGTIGSILNLELNAAPTVTGGVTQNLALITYNDGIHSAGAGDNSDFFSPSGTDLTNGSIITETFNGQPYSWQLEYAGSVSSVSSEISSSNISGTGGSLTGVGTVVLVGQPFVAVPEPASLGLLVLGSAGLFVRRRRRTVA